MIQDLLETIITEVMDSKFEISEFHLGEIPYKILKQEIEGQIQNCKVDIEKVNFYKGILISLHPSNDAVMFGLKLKQP